MVLRDVIERNAISNPMALRWMQRQLLASPAAPFSIEKLHSALRSQGIPVGKDSLHAYLAHLEDAFLIATVSLHTDSERKRMVHPRKAYPIDPGFIPLFERMGSLNTGQALETVVLLELLRCGYQVGYVTTADGWEVDFYAHAPGRKPLMLQVTASLHDPTTRERETRALISAASLYPQAIVLLVSLDGALPGAALPAPLRWMPAARWLLEDEDQG
jgi:predicted AAA+ superfamily ATPase